MDNNKELLINLNKALLYIKFELLRLYQKLKLFNYYSLFFYVMCEIFYENNITFNLILFNYLLMIFFIYFLLINSYII